MASGVNKYWEKHPNCELCGALLPEPDTPKGCKRYCDECAQKLKHERDREVCRNQSSLRRTKTAEQKKPKKTLAQVAAEANKLHLSYGRYVELMQSGSLERYCKDHDLEMPEESA